MSKNGLPRRLRYRERSVKKLKETLETNFDLIQTETVETFDIDYNTSSIMFYGKIMLLLN